MFQNPRSSRSIPGSWHLGASFPARERQNSLCTQGMEQMWGTCSRVRDIPGILLPRDPPGVPVLFVLLLLPHSPREQPREGAPNTPSTFTVPSPISDEPEPLTPTP